MLTLRLLGIDEIAVGMRLTLLRRGGLALLPVTADGAAGVTFLDEQTLARFKDGSYRWVACKRFRIDPAVDDRAILRAVIAHPHYRDSYYLDSISTEPIHGPYNLIRMTLDSFIESSGSTAAAAFDDWVGAHGAVSPSEIDGDLHQIEHLICTSRRRYRLPDLGERADHISGWILHRPFFELILIDKSQRQLHLVVASGD